MALPQILNRQGMSWRFYHSKQDLLTDLAAYTRLSKEERAFM
jgi:hypothetical protein